MSRRRFSSKDKFQLPPRNQISIAIGLVFASGSMPAFAEPQADATTQETELPTVTVEGAQIEAPRGSYKPVKTSSPKYTEPLRDTPQSITVVPQQVIQDRAATSLRDVMRNVSGISLVAGEGGGAQGDNFRIRGFAANNDLFLDGMRDLAQTSRDPFNLDSVEVAKGPSSSIAGRGATGGAINQVSKAPFLESLRSGTFMLGTDATKRITVDVNEPLKGYGPDVALRLNAMVHDAEVADRDEIFLKRWGIAPSLAIGLGTATRYTLSLFHQDDDNLPDYGLPFLAGETIKVNGKRLDRSNYYGLKDIDTEQTEASAATFKVEHDLNESLMLRNQLRYSRNTRLAIVSPPRTTSALVATDTVNRNPTGRDALNTLWINQTDITRKLKTGTIEHSIVGGIELAREGFENQAFNFNPTGPATSLTNPDPEPAYNPARVDGTQTDNSADGLAAYVSDSIKLNEQWEVSGGLRWDRFVLDSESTTNTGVVTEADRTDTETSWRLATVYKPVEHASFYAAYGTSFNPSAEALTLSTSGTANNNADLAPEKNRSLELGTKWDVLDEHLALTAALFRIEKTNARTRDPADATSLTALDGKQIVDGIELGVSGNLSRNWQAFASTTYLDSEITQSNNPLEEGNEIGNTPDKTLNFWTTYQLPNNLEVGFGGLYVGERAVSNTVQTRLDSYTLFDAMLGYQMNTKLKLQANLYNMTDELYFDRFHGGGQHGIPGAGRTLLLSASFKY